MASGTYILLGLLFVCNPLGVSSQQPFPQTLNNATSGDPMLQERLKVGSNVVVECTVRSRRNMTFFGWKLPDVPRERVLVREGEIWNGVQVSKNGWSITFTEVLYTHGGDYDCYMRDTDGKIMYYRTNVNVFGPSLAERYRLNIIIGCVAALAIPLIALIAYLVYANRYEARMGLEDKYEFDMGDVSTMEAPRVRVPNPYLNQGGSFEESGRPALTKQASTSKV